MVTSVIFIIVMATISTSLLNSSMSERKQIEMEQNRIIAFNLAEAGVDSAVAALSLDANYAGTGNALSLGDGSYSVSVIQPDPGGNPNVRKIISTGYAPDNQTASYAYQERTVTSYITITPQALYAQPIFAEKAITLKGNTTTDSYDSDLGAYGESGNVGSEGHIVSNTIAQNSITLTGNANVDGDVTVGTGGDPNSVIAVSGNATIQGNTLVNNSQRVFDPVSIPENLLPSGELLVETSTTRPLAGGAHLFSGVTIESNSTLNIAGPVELYVTGDVSIVADTVNTPDNKPANFIIKISGDNEVTLQGDGSLYGVIYAPEAGKFQDGISLNGSPSDGNLDFFGAVVGHKVTSDNTNIHYDAALADAGNSSKSETDVVSWQES